MARSPCTWQGLQSLLSLLAGGPFLLCISTRARCPSPVATSWHTRVDNDDRCIAFCALCDLLDLQRSAKNDATCERNALQVRDASDALNPSSLVELMARSKLLPSFIRGIIDRLEILHESFECLLAKSLQLERTYSALSLRWKVV